MVCPTPFFIIEYPFNATAIQTSSRIDFGSLEALPFKWTTDDAVDIAVYVAQKAINFMIKRNGYFFWCTKFCSHKAKNKQETVLFLIYVLGTARGIEKHMWRVSVQNKKKNVFARFCAHDKEWPYNAEQIKKQ